MHPSVNRQTNNRLTGTRPSHLWTRPLSTSSPVDTSSLYIITFGHVLSLHHHLDQKRRVGQLMTIKVNLKNIDPDVRRRHVQPVLKHEGAVNIARVPYTFAIHVRGIFDVAIAGLSTTHPPCHLHGWMVGRLDRCDGYNTSRGRREKHKGRQTGREVGRQAGRQAGRYMD